MASMNFPRTFGFSLVTVGNVILAIGSGGNEGTLIEVYGRDLDSWTPMPQWNGPYQVLDRHCAVSINDHQLMIIGGISYMNVSRILDINTGEWKNTATSPTPRHSV